MSRVCDAWWLSKSAATAEDENEIYSSWQKSFSGRNFLLALHARRDSRVAPSTVDPLWIESSAWETVFKSSEPIEVYAAIPLYAVAQEINHNRVRQKRNTK
jgi:hypothetical protein